MDWAIWQNDEAVALIDAYRKDPDNRELREMATQRLEEGSDLLRAVDQEADLSKEGPEEFMARAEEERQRLIETEAGSWDPEGLGLEGSPDQEAALERESQEWAAEEGLLRGILPTGVEVYADAVSGADAATPPSLIASDDLDLPNNPAGSDFFFPDAPSGDDLGHLGGGFFREFDVLKEN